MGKFDLSTATVGELLDDERVVAILEREVPGLTKSPMVRMARGMSAQQALTMIGARADKERIDAVRAEVEALD